jgi:hypothetical protein
MHQSYQIQYLEEIDQVAESLATYFPDAKLARLGLHELLLNALEHGNLGITYDEKTALVHTGNWRQEALRRLALPQNQHKQIHTHLLQSDHGLTLYIRDEGQGFVWQPYLECSAERLHHPHGRGIALAKELCFESLTYSALGNEVVARVAG